MEKDLVFIPYNVPSLKNSKVYNGKVVLPSKSVRNYLLKFNIKRYDFRTNKIILNKKKYPDGLKPYMDMIKSKLDDKLPVKMGFHFVRNSRRKFDFINAVQILADLMKVYGVFEDDNMDFFIPFPLKLKDKWYSYSKTRSGVYIKIIKD